MMRVQFTADMTHSQAAVVWRCRDALSARGIELGADIHGPDLHLVHSPQFVPEMLDGPPVVVLERIDGAQLTGTVRRALPRLAGVIKNTIYADWMRYNGAAWRNHEPACRGEPERLLPEPDWITAADYQKLHIGFSFAAYDHMAPLLTEQYSGDRPYLLNFAGTVDYGPEMDWLNRHRQSALDAIRKIPGRHFCEPGRPLPREAYWESLRQSRFCVSPWGLGEACWRDFEAILCGCVLIKPDSRHVLTSPRGFYASGGVVACRADFEDLGECVGRWESVDWSVKEIRDACSTEEIASRVAKCLSESSLSRRLTGAPA